MARSKSPRFVSRYGNYTVGVQSEVSEHFGTGERRIIKPFIEAHFQRKWVNDRDYAIALESFKFNGLPEDVDTRQDLKPRFRVSVWDADEARKHFGFDDDTINMIVEKLRSTEGPNHREVLSDPLNEPLPNYDTLDLEQIVTAVKLLNIDPDLIVAYEEENEDREEVKHAVLNIGQDVVVDA